MSNSATTCWIKLSSTSLEKHGHHWVTCNTVANSSKTLVSVVKTAWKLSLKHFRSIEPKAESKSRLFDFTGSLVPHTWLFLASPVLAHSRVCTCAISSIMDLQDIAQLSLFEWLYFFLLGFWVGVTGLDYYTPPFPLFSWQTCCYLECIKKPVSYWANNGLFAYYLM